MQIISKGKRTTRGFTLIELVIVIAVIAILAALLVPTILGQAERARLSRAHGDAASIAKSIARLRTDSGITDASCLTTTTNLSVAAGTSLTNCSNVQNVVKNLSLCTQVTPGYICYGGPYMTTVSNDPWNKSYSVTVDTTTYAITVKSAGPDGTWGNTDDVTYVQ